MQYRYFVAVTMDSKTDEKLREFYKNIFLSPLPVKNLHMSLVPTFYIKEEYSESDILQIISKIEFQPFTSKISNLGIFEQKGKKILYTKVSPKEECVELSKKISTSLIRLINIDTAPYTNGIVPEFDPHITLNYSFDSVVTDSLPELSFVTDRVVVMKETEDGWVVCGP